MRWIIGMDKNAFELVSRYPGCVLDKNKKFVFVCHNKVAQTSINRVVLKKRAVVQKDGKLRYWWHRRSVAKIFDVDPPFTFTIVRNPYSRTVSAFNYLKKKNKIGANVEFREFVQTTLRTQREKFDPHFIPQCRWPLTMAQLGFDLIGHFERLEEDWHAISKQLGVSTKLPHANRTSSWNWRDFYDDSTQWMVYELYQRDFEELGYPFQI
jgi:hypothetical protein